MDLVAVQCGQVPSSDVIVQSRLIYCSGGSPEVQDGKLDQQPS